MSERPREEGRPPEPIGSPVTEPDGAILPKGAEPCVEAPRPQEPWRLTGAAEALAAIPLGFGPLGFALGALGLFGAAALWALRAPGVFQLMTPLPAIAGLALLGTGWSVVGLGLARRAAWARAAAAAVGILGVLLSLLGLPSAEVGLGAAILALTFPLLREAREPDGTVATPSAAYFAAVSWGVLVVLVLAAWPELVKATIVLWLDKVPPRARDPVPGLLLALVAPAAVVLPAPLASVRARAATVAAHVAGALVVLALLVAIVREALA